MNQIKSEHIKSAFRLEAAMLKESQKEDRDIDSIARAQRQLADFKSRINKNVRRFLHNNPRIENCNPKVWGG